MTLTVEEILELRIKNKSQNNVGKATEKLSARKTSRSGIGKWGKNTLRKLNEILILCSDDTYVGDS